MPVRLLEVKEEARGEDRREAERDPIARENPNECITSLSMKGANVRIREFCHEADRIAKDLSTLLGQYLLCSRES